MNSYDQDADKGKQCDIGVFPFRPEEILQLLKINQRKRSHQNNSCQYRNRNVVEQRRKKEQGQGDHPRTNNIGESRSEEHTSELQSRGHLVCRLLLEKKKTKK